MTNENYKTVRVYNETYEKLREIKYIENESFVEILKNSIDDTHKTITQEAKRKSQKSEENDS